MTDQPSPTLAAPPSVLIERFVVTTAPEALFLRFDGLALAGPGGGLVPVPAFSGVIAPANALALAHALQEALKARVTLTADPANPQ